MLTLLHRSLATNPAIRDAVLLQAGMAAFSLAAMAFDHRQVLGLNVWMKPFKFDVSIAIVLLTAAVFLDGLQGFDEARIWAGSILAFALGIESVLISLQAARGVRSHLNVSTAFDAHVWMGMGLMALVGTLAMGAIFALTFAAESRWPIAVLWGIRLGLVLFLAGSIEGSLMVRHGGHTIGAMDGGSGMPVVNWSRGHGDLRVAHFVALHALQALPFFGYLIARTSWHTSWQVVLVVLLSLAYTGAVWLLFRLAMQGRPLAFPS